MAGKQEWELDKQEAEQEHFDKYGFLSDDFWEDDFSDSWGEMADQGDSWSWDYPDPLSEGSLP